MSSTSILLARARNNHTLQDVWTAMGALPSAITNNSGGGNGMSIRGEASGVKDVVYGLTGSTWSTLAVYPTTGERQSSCGLTSSAILAANGEINSPSYSPKSKATFSFNGTAWASEADDITLRTNAGMGGASNDAINVGGIGVSATLKTVSFFNGTTWASKGNTNYAAERLVVCGSSSSTILKVGGSSGGTALANTEIFDGTTWTNGSAYTYACSDLAGVGDSSKGSVFGGIRTGTGGTYNKDHSHRSGGVWAARANMLIGRANFAASRLPNNAVVAGGYDGSSRLSNTERYS